MAYTASLQPSITALDMLGRVSCFAETIGGDGAI